MKKQKTKLKKNLDKRNHTIELLEDYSRWLMKHGYLDTDWMVEPPFAIDEFMKHYKKNEKAKDAI